MKLEKEAQEFKKQRQPKKKLSAAKRTVMRAYMSSALTGLLSSGRPLRTHEAIEEAYQWALLCLQFEEDNF